MQPTAHRARALRLQGALAALRYVQARPGTTRAELARALGLSSGSAAEITARLKAMRLLAEIESPPTGERGRPSPTLTAHPDGPLVCVVEISHERWRTAVVELGGRILHEESGRHADRTPANAPRGQVSHANDISARPAEPAAAQGQAPGVDEPGRHENRAAEAARRERAAARDSARPAEPAAARAAGQEERSRHPERTAAEVLEGLRRRVEAVYGRYGQRLRAVSVVAAATVQGTRLVQASTLGWREVDLEPLRPAPGVSLLAGNDASLAGLAEARRGAGMDGRAVLHLTVEVGVGGILVVDGRPVDGATGAGGEFGHMPFGDPGLLCPCGAYGCWDLEVDGRAMARALGRPMPDDPRTEAERVLAAAPRDPAARRVVGAAARAFGRGTGALVNALDPDLVTLSGLATELLGTAPEELVEGYEAGLMRFRRAAPPPLRSTALGAGGPVMGAAEVAFDTVLTDAGLEAWSGG